MRKRTLHFLKQHPHILDMIYKIGRTILSFIGFFIPLRNRIVFASFGGRKFDDSPKALYDNLIKQEEFQQWEFVWFFSNPEEFDIPIGKKVKIDTIAFLYYLLSSRIWISNSGMDRDIGIRKKNVVKVETWHGTPLKKIGGEENTNSMIIKRRYRCRTDSETIRCAQSEYDREIFARIFHSSKDAILMSDLPRNDELVFGIDEKKCLSIRQKIGIPEDKKVLLYMPTYREYLFDKNCDLLLAPPINVKKWKKSLGEEYVLLIKAHYAITKSMEIKDDGFVFDVSTYPSVNDLYLIADEMISDYSSAFFDYSILNKPMYCFAYDLEEYKKRRGLYLELSEVLPCTIDKNEDEVIKHIKNNDKNLMKKNTAKFHECFAPYAGNATENVVKQIKQRVF